jgi:hypothetical protein
LKEDSGAPGAVGPGAKGLQDLIDDEPSAFAVKLVRDFDADVIRMEGGPLPPVVLGKYSLFNRLAVVICRKCVVLSNLNIKILKIENLFGGVRGAGPEAMPRPGLRTIHNSQLQDSGLRETIGKLGGGGSR